MFKHTFAKFAGTAVVAAALGVAAFTTAATASAAGDKAADKEFVANVTSLGIEVTTDNKESVIEVGHAVCDALDENQDPDDIVAALKEGNDITTKQAQGFVVASAVSYCPEYIEES